MVEWFMAPVLKTGDPARDPGVRIPLSPPKMRNTQKLNGEQLQHLTNGGLDCIVSHYGELAERSKATAWKAVIVMMQGFESLILRN